jgi:hypothetical protein
MSKLNNDPMQIANLRISRRSFLSIAAASFLTGCADSPVLVNAYEAVEFLVVGLEDKEIDRSTINGIPYASISAKIGRGPRSILVLGKQQGHDLHWFSADDAVLVTRNGRIIRTAGFPENIRNTTFSDEDPVARQFHRSNFSKRSLRSIDMDPNQLYGVPVISNYEVVGEREIMISGIKIKTRLVREYNTSFSINWTFSNYYWADIYDGFIWKSRQYIARGFDPLDIEVLKPPA